MIMVITEFKENVKEVEAYFVMLENIENGYTKLSNSAGSAYQIDGNLSRMLKANAFLIVYNLIEATIKNGLWEVFESIKADKISYQKLIREIQLLWIDHRIKLEFTTREESVNSKILNVVEEVLGSSLNYYSQKQHLKFDAGTLDLKGIHKTFKRHGISEIPAHTAIDSSFRTITKNRNSLAHGDMTFVDCGKSYSYRDLRIIKCHAIRYLFKTLFHIKQFIEAKTYKKVEAEMA